MSGRFTNPVISIEAKTIRHMRLSKKISLNQAGRILRITGSAIAHFEQGRMELSSARIETMVTAYGYRMDEFYEFLDGKPIPLNFRDECLILIRKMDESQLPVVHALLQSLAPKRPDAAPQNRAQDTVRKQPLTKINSYVNLRGVR